MASNEPIVIETNTTEVGAVLAEQFELGNKLGKFEWMPSEDTQTVNVRLTFEEK